MKTMFRFLGFVFCFCALITGCDNTNDLEYQTQLYDKLNGYWFRIPTKTNITNEDSIYALVEKDTAWYDFKDKAFSGENGNYSFMSAHSFWFYGIDPHILIIGSEYFICLADFSPDPASGGTIEIEKKENGDEIVVTNRHNTVRYKIIELNDRNLILYDIHNSSYLAFFRGEDPIVRNDSLLAQHRALYDKHYWYLSQKETIINDNETSIEKIVYSDDYWAVEVAPPIHIDPAYNSEPIVPAMLRLYLGKYNTTDGYTQVPNAKFVGYLCYCNTTVGDLFYKIEAIPSKIFDDNLYKRMFQFVEFQDGHVKLMTKRKDENDNNITEYYYWKALNDY